MSNYLVPSSPVAFGKANHTPSSRPNGAVTDTKRQHVTLATASSSNNNNLQQFPTPNPSSSIGDIPSSPIKNPFNTETQPQTPNHITSILLQFTKSQSQSQTPNVVVLGRSSTLSDIMLPPRHGISKRHIRITYLAQNNKVKLECIGLNSIVVSVPYNSNTTTNNNNNYYVRQLDSDESLCELLLPNEVESIGVEKLHSVFLKAGSFSLKCGEGCIMSLLEGMSVSVKGVVRVVISGLASSSSFSSSSSVGSGLEMGTRVTYLAQEEEEVPNTPDAQRLVTTPGGSPNFSDSDSEQLVTSEFPQTPFVYESHSDPRTPVKLKKNYSFREESPLIRKPRSKKSTGRKECNTQFIRARPVTVVSSPIFNTQREQSPSSSILSSPLSPSKHTKRRKRAHFETSKAFNDLDLLPPVNIQSKRRRTSSNASQEENTKQHLKETLETDLLQSMASRGINCEEIQHVLSNYLAFASVQQVPFSHLRTCSGIISSLSQKELRALLRAERSIGVIERHGRDAAGNPLEEEYYYDLENDEDRDRQRLVSSVKGGRVGLRACRKTHKQYFWKKPEHRVRRRE